MGNRSFLSSMHWTAEYCWRSLYSKRRDCKAHCTILSSVQLTSAQPSVNHWFRDWQTAAYGTSAAISRRVSVVYIAGFQTTCHVNRDIQLRWSSRYAAFEDCVYKSVRIYWPMKSDRLAFKAYRWARLTCSPWQVMWLHISCFSASDIILALWPWPLTGPRT